MKKVLSFLKPYRVQCVLAPLFKLLEVGFELLVPLVIASIIDRGIAQQDTPYVLKMCGLLVAFAAVGYISAVAAQYFASVAAVGFGTATRMALFTKIQSLSYAELDNLGTATMMTRITSDVNQAQTGVNLVLRLLLRSPFVVFGAMLMAFSIDAKTALIFVGVIAALAVTLFLIMLFTIPLYRRTQEKLDRVLGLTRENLTGARVIRAFCMEEREVAGFAVANDTLLQSQKKVGVISALTNPITYVLINIGVVGLIWSGALRVNLGALTQGQVIALYNYMAQILVELVKLANLIVTVTKSIAGAKRIGGVFALSSSLTDPKMAPKPVPGAPAVVFHNVDMMYPGTEEPALTDVSFVLEPGQTLGVIGGTGAGKTTLVNLVARFYEVSDGRVEVSGVDVRDYPQDLLRQKIGVVPQRALLFSGTIRENLLWGNAEATDEQLYEALRIAQAMDVIASKPEGLDAYVEAGGRNFSGGQRQRLTIARALVRHPAILILDDSASALDYATDARLRHALRESAGDMSVFIVSQRTSSVRHADKIVVLDDGHVVGVGTHEELRESCAVYKEICDSQEKGGAES